MPLFQKKENLSDEEKKLSVVTFWLFVVALFSWVIPFTLLFVLQLTTETVGGAMGAALMPSIVTFIVAAVLCVIAYFAIIRKYLSNRFDYSSRGSQSFCDCFQVGQVQFQFLKTPMQIAPRDKCRADVQQFFRRQHAAS